MIRTVLVLFLLGACAFFFYQKQQAEVPSAPQEMLKLDESSLMELKRSIPSSVFEKEIKPFWEENGERGLTPGQAEDLAKKLEKIGKIFGGKAGEAVEKFIDGLDPERKRQASDVRRWLDDGIDSVKAGMPGWKAVAEDLINGLGSVFSKLFDGAADLLLGK